MVGDKWEFVAGFVEFDVASAVARNRTSRVRLVHAVYEDNKLVAQDVLADVRATRLEP